jgi:hypothetical protein
MTAIPAGEEVLAGRSVLEEKRKTFLWYFCVKEQTDKYQLPPMTGPFMCKKRAKDQANEPVKRMKEQPNIERES